MTPPKEYGEPPYRLTELGQRVVRENFGLIGSTIKRLGHRGGAGLTNEERMSVGYMALCKAVACYVPGRGALSSYVSGTIWRELIRESRRNRVIPPPSYAYKPGNTAAREMGAGSADG